MTMKGMATTRCVVNLCRIFNTILKQSSEPTASQTFKLVNVLCKMLIIFLTMDGNFIDDSRPLLCHYQLIIEWPMPIN